jgi:hypothetical protein
MDADFADRFNKSALRRQMKILKTWSLWLIRSSHNPLLSDSSWQGEMELYELSGEFDKMVLNQSRSGYHRFFDEDTPKKRH